MSDQADGPEFATHGLLMNTLAGMPDGHKARFALIINAADINGDLITTRLKLRVYKVDRSVQGEIALVSKTSGLRHVVAPPGCIISNIEDRGDSAPRARSQPRSDAPAASSDDMAAAVTGLLMQQIGPVFDSLYASIADLQHQQQQMQTQIVTTPSAPTAAAPAAAAPAAAPIAAAPIAAAPMAIAPIATAPMAAAQVVAPIAAAQVAAAPIAAAQVAAAPIAAAQVAAAPTAAAQVAAFAPQQPLGGLLPPAGAGPNDVVLTTTVPRVQLEVGRGQTLLNPLSPYMLKLSANNRYEDQEKANRTGHWLVMATVLTPTHPGRTSSIGFLLNPFHVLEGDRHAVIARVAGLHGQLATAVGNIRQTHAPRRPNPHHNGTPAFILCTEAQRAYSAALLRIAEGAYPQTPEDWQDVLWLAVTVLGHAVDNIRSHEKGGAIIFETFRTTLRKTGLYDPDQLLAALPA
jgi:hypothetical protein